MCRRDMPAQLRRAMRGRGVRVNKLMLLAGLPRSCGVKVSRDSMICGWVGWEGSVGQGAHHRHRRVDRAPPPPPSQSLDQEAAPLRQQLSSSYTRKQACRGLQGSAVAQ